MLPSFLICKFTPTDAMFDTTPLLTLITVIWFGAEVREKNWLFWAQTQPVYFDLIKIGQLIKKWHYGWTKSFDVLSPGNLISMALVLTLMMSKNHGNT